MVKFTENDSARVSFLIRLSTSSLQLYQKKTQAQMLHFPVNSVEFFRGPFFPEHSRWLLLHDHVRITLMVYESNISMVYKYSIILKKFLFSSLCTEVTLKIIFCVENELWCSEITNAITKCSVWLEIDLQGLIHPAIYSGSELK